MENTTNIANVTKNTGIKVAIMENAVKGVKVSTKNSGIDKMTLTTWKNLVNDVRKAIIIYADALQTEESAHCVKVQDARVAFFTALDNVRKFSGLSFPNGFERYDEIAIWLAYLSRPQKERDSNGNIVDMPLAIASPETVRGHIEIMLYLRESGKAGMTVAQYEEEKARRKAEKQKKRADEQRKKQAEKKKAELEADLQARIEAVNAVENANTTPTETAPTEPTEKAVA